MSQALRLMLQNTSVQQPASSLINGGTSDTSTKPYGIINSDTTKNESRPSPQKNAMDVLACFCCGDRKKSTALSNSLKPNSEYEIRNEKMTYYRDDSPICTQDETAKKLIDTIFTSTQSSNDLSNTLDAIVEEKGWWDKAIAKAVLGQLEKRLQTGKQQFGPALEHAYDRAYEEMNKMAEFAGKRPVVTGVVCAIVALGLLYLLWPAIVEALGFGELGIIRGSFAAGWQSLYPDVPVGSVFAFLQRLGMTLK